jgi:hypothetical protein
MGLEMFIGISYGHVVSSVSSHEYVVAFHLWVFQGIDLFYPQGKQ